MPGVPLEAQDIAELGAVIDLAKTYTALAEDRVARARDAEQARGVPGTEPSDLVATVFTPHTQAAELERFRKPGDNPVTPGIMPRAQDDGACDVPPHEKTKDGRRVMSLLRPYLPGSARGISTADYAANLKQVRAAMAAEAVTAPAAKPRMSSPEFAALRAGKGAAHR